LGYKYDPASAYRAQAQAQWVVHGVREITFS